MALVVKGFVQQWASKPSTQLISMGAGVVAAAAGFSRARDLMDESSDSVASIGTLFRYPLQYGIIGAAFGFAWPITIGGFMTYSAWYEYQHSHTMW